MINPSTPGTLVVLAGSLLLSLSTLSTPVIKSIFFLSAKVDATVSSTKISGTLKLGTLGYCIELGSQLACSPLRFGYDISPGSIASLPQVTNLDIPTDLIKTLSYALILHPIAAGLALISAIVGFIAHFREYSQSCLTSFFTSLAATAAFLAFAFDIVAFNIAKSRIVDASTSSTRTEATLGKAIWITLGGWLCLAFSGVFFCVGRCVVRKKRFNQAHSATLRPIADDMFASQMRQEALEAEEANKKSARKKNETSIPTFSEFGSEDVAHERIPLARFEESNEENRFSDHQPFRAHSEENYNNYRAGDAHAPEVVGGFRPPSNLSRLNSIGVESNYTQNKYPSRRGTLTSNQPKPVGNMYNDLPPHVTPASNSMSASPQNSQLDDPQNLLSTEGSKQNFRAQLPGDDRYYIPSVSSQLSQNLMYPTYDRPKFPHYTEASSHHSEFRPEQSGDTYITGANLNRREQGYESHQNNVAESYGQFTPSQESHAQFHSQLPIAHNLVGDPYAAVRQPHGEFVNNQVFLPDQHRSAAQNVYQSEQTQFPNEYSQPIQSNYPGRSGSAAVEAVGQTAYHSEPSQFSSGFPLPIQSNHPSYLGQATTGLTDLNPPRDSFQPVNHEHQQYRSHYASQSGHQINEADVHGWYNPAISQSEDLRVSTQCDAGLSRETITAHGTDHFQGASGSNETPPPGYR